MFIFIANPFTYSALLTLSIVLDHLHAPGPPRGKNKVQMRRFPLDYQCIDLLLLKITFLDAPSHLYKRVRPSVHPSVRPSVRLSVCPSVRRSIRRSVTPSLRRLLGAFYAEYPALSDAFSHLYKRVCPSVGPSVRHTRVETMQKRRFRPKLLSVRTRTHLMPCIRPCSEEP